DLAAMGMHPLTYPLRDFNFRDTQGSSHEYEHQRIRVLSRLLSGECDCVVCCLDAALQYTIPPDELRRRTAVLSAAQKIAPEKAVQTLAACGYERAEQIEGAGQFSLRGGILDFFTPGAENPVRVEFWGDEIDTLSFFDPETQRRTDSVPRAVVTPSVEAPVEHPEVLARRIRTHAASLRGKNAPAAKQVLLEQAEKLENHAHIGCADKYIPFLYEKPATLFDYADDSTLLFVSEPAKAKERMRTVLWQWGEDIRDYLSEGVLCRGLDTYSGDWQYALSQFERLGAVYLDTFVRSSYDTPLRTLQNVTARQLSVWGGSLPLLLEDVQAMLANHWACVILAGTERAARTLTADLQAKDIPAVHLSDPQEAEKGVATVTEGSLSAGLEYPGAGFGLITHGRILAPARKKAKKRAPNSQEIYSLAELSPGDYVVHATHGIGV
ncbi:MAG TPA: transcription-repair coupling factor, partial [Ruminococcaceae bacterium]|nr:transcription-repair coupling factor [Oscillospiraceae bacterium]